MSLLDDLKLSQHLQKENMELKAENEALKEKYANALSEVGRHDKMIMGYAEDCIVEKNEMYHSLLKVEASFKLLRSVVYDSIRKEDLDPMLAKILAQGLPY